jgi:chromosomal replication initiation ATPase DnaA
MNQPPSFAQYTLPLIRNPDFTSYSYFVSESNRAAYQLIETWPNWMVKRYVVWGPSGYGKTHFGHILKDRTQGIFLTARHIDRTMLETITNNSVYIIDDIHRLESPEMLFHFYNLTLEKECWVVYLSNTPPGQLDTKLADLNSRLRSLPLLEIQQADDNMCCAIMKKVFADLQIDVSDTVVHYLLAHTSRNLTDIHQNIQRLNQLSLEQKRNITIPLIKASLDVK